ncbi:hypothetical protein HOC13_02055 [Candidatus Woesearchaeota archaeon]|jgi:hypothetical protein|nr:hypothetical protein [Candidatus Woesearchaeota archaeon]
MALGMTLSNAVEASINGFINYALIVVSAMILWYAVKFVFIGSIGGGKVIEGKKKKDDTLEKRRKEFKEFIGDRKAVAEKKRKEKKEHGEEQKKKNKEDEEKRKRKEAVLVPIDSLVKALNLTEEIANLLTDGNRREAKRKMDNLKEEFHHTWRKLKHARAEHEGEWQGFFDRYASAAQSLRSKVESEVIRKLPRRTTDANWNNRVNGIKAQLTAIKNQSLPILNELKKV